MPLAALPHNTMPLAAAMPTEAAPSPPSKLALAGSTSPDRAVPAGGAGGAGGASPTFTPVAKPRHHDGDLASSDVLNPVSCSLPPARCPPHTHSAFARDSVPSHACVCSGAQRTLIQCLYLPKDEETLTASATQTRLFKEKGAMVSNAIILVEGNISAGKSTLCNSVSCSLPPAQQHARGLRGSALIARVSTLQQAVHRAHRIYLTLALAGDLQLGKVMGLKVEQEPTETNPYLCKYYQGAILPLVQSRGPRRCIWRLGLERGGRQGCWATTLIQRIVLAADPKRWAYPMQIWLLRQRYYVYATAPVTALLYRAPRHTLASEPPSWNRVIFKK